MAELQDQQHPQYNGDRQILNDLLKSEPTDRNLADLARLRIRYTGFPGARDIQADLLKAMKRWDLTEAELFAKTRQIHATTRIFSTFSDKRNDWA